MVLFEEDPKDLQIPDLKLTQLRFLASIGDEKAKQELLAAIEERST
jgi:hypothetical protein